MPSYQDEAHSVFSKFDSMTNEELEEILRIDAEKSEDEDSDMDMLMYVMGVLAKRRKNSADPGKTPEEAYKSFVENYCTDDAEVTDESIHKTIIFKPKRNRSGWKRILTAAAACVAIVVCGAFTTNALGDDTFEQFFDWTKEVFFFSPLEQTEVSGPSDEYELEDVTLEESLMEMNIPLDLVPLQAPPGFKQVEISVLETPQVQSVVAHFEKGEQFLRIRVREALLKDPVIAEKSGELLEIYEYGDISYYIFSNLDKICVVWKVENYECKLYGNLSVDEMKELIHSIQEG